jgi:hypothetical protein
VWASPEWRGEAVAWLDDRLRVAGIERTGEAEQPHLRPWATVLRVPTTAGAVWFKAAGPGTAFEAGLYELLARVAPDRVLVPLATDPEQGWIVLPDGGPPLAQRRSDGPGMADALATTLVHYGELQRTLVPHVDDLLDLGVADMRPAAMPQRFDQALAVTGAELDRGGSDADRATHERVAAMRATVESWCERLAASGVPPSLDHNDLHPWNILGDGTGPTRFYDWGDSVVAHPFAAMLVPLGFIRRHLDVALDHPRFVAARDAYLDVFTSLAPDEDLAATLEVACRVAKVARVLTWDRALQAARDEGEAIDDDWASAPFETLASLLDEPYIGGA